MLQIIRTEWLKVRSYRTFWVLLLLAAVLIPAANYIVAETSNAVKSETKGMLNLSVYDFPLVWQTTAFVSRFMNVLLGFLLIILVTNEFTFKTNRQNIIDGWERKQFILAKLFWVVLFTLLTTLVVIITAITFGAAYGTHDFSVESSYYMGYFMLYTVLSLCLALLISVLTRRAGIAIVLYLAYVMVIENILSALINHYIGPFGRLLPLSTGQQLIGLPLFGKLIPDADRYDDTVYMAMLGLYLAIMVYLVFRKLLKTDL